MFSGFSHCHITKNAFLCIVIRHKTFKNDTTMKRIMMTLAVMVTMFTSAAAMSLSKARTEALFLSDKMAYELGLSLSQYEAVYEINLDYMLGLNTVADLDGVYWMRRNVDLRYVLSGWQWERYTQIPDFYRPMVWVNRHNFSLVIRDRYTYRDQFYFERPSIYKSFKGGHNVGHESYYANREFHRPATQNVAPQHYGSSAPRAYGSGSTRGNRNQPTYHEQGAQRHDVSPQMNSGERDRQMSNGTRQSNVGGQQNSNAGNRSFNSTNGRSTENSSRSGSSRGASTMRK